MNMQYLLILCIARLSESDYMQVFTVPFVGTPLSIYVFGMYVWLLIWSLLYLIHVIWPRTSKIQENTPLLLKKAETGKWDFLCAPEKS